MKIYRSAFLPAFAGFIVIATIIPYAARAEELVTIVRPGDNAMTCPALAAEINTLGQQSIVAAPKKKHGFGFLKVVGAVVPGVGMLNGVAGGLISSAAAAGSMASGNGARNGLPDQSAAVREAIRGGSPAQQRKARLVSIFDERHC